MTDGRGGVVVSMVGGFLCNIAWPFTFLTYAIGLVAIIVVLAFMPDIPLDSITVNEGGEAKQRRSIPAYIWLLCVVIFLLMMLSNPVYVSMSTIVVQGGVGNGGTVGAILSFFTIGGVVGGLAYGFLDKTFGNLLIPGYLVLCGIGMLIICFGGNVPLLIVGTFLSGLACMGITPAFMAEANAHVDSSSFAFASGALMAAMNFGGFATSPFFAALASIGYGSPFDLMLISAIAFFFVAAATLLVMKTVGKKAV